MFGSAKPSWMKFVYSLLWCWEMGKNVPFALLDSSRNLSPLIGRRIHVTFVTWRMSRAGLLAVDNAYRICRIWSKLLIWHSLTLPAKNRCATEREGESRALPSDLKGFTPYPPLNPLYTTTETLLQKYNRAHWQVPCSRQGLLSLIGLLYCQQNNFLNWVSWPYSNCKYVFYALFDT